MMKRMIRAMQAMVRFPSPGSGLARASLLAPLLLLCGLAAPARADVGVLGAPRQVSGSDLLPAVAVPPGANRLLVVTVSLADLSGAFVGAPFSVSWGGQPMTRAVQIPECASSFCDSIWFLALGTGGSTVFGDVVVARPTNAAFQNALVSAQAFFNVDQSTPISSTQVNEATNANGSSVSVPGAAGDLVFDLFEAVHTSAVATTAGVGQTVLASQPATFPGILGSFSGFGSYKTSMRPGGAPNVVSSWTTTPGSVIQVVQLAINIKQATAAPANDAFASAIRLLNSTTSWSGSNVGATKEAGEPNHGGNGNAGGKSIWFDWTAPATGSVTIDTCGSNFDTLLGVYTGAAVNALSAPVASNDDGCAQNTLQSKVLFNASAGTFYRIAVDGFNFGSGAASGNVVLAIAQTAAPQIIQQPANQSVLVGGVATFEAQAAATPAATIQWQVSFNGGAAWSNLTGGSAIQGETTPVLTISPAAAVQNGFQFRAVFTNSQGTATTNPATLTVTQALTVSKTGTGSGTVTSSPTGINCGATCGANFPSGSVLALTAAPATGFVFTGWAGACSGAGSCNLIMDAAKNVTATFDKTQTTTTLTATPNPVTVGQLTHIAATLLGVTSAGGTFALTADGNPLGSASALSGTTNLTVDTSSLSTGAHTILASFAGNATSAPSSASVTLNVIKTPVTLALTASPAGTTGFGQSVTFTATIGNGFQPGGTIDFKDGAVTIASGVVVSGAKATFTTSALALGAHSIGATYSGDTNNSATSALALSYTIKSSQTINFTSTAPTRPFVGGPGYTPTATATSSLAVTLAIDAASANVCSMSSGVVGFQRRGSCVINADQAGNGNYNAATRVQQILNIAPATRFDFNSDGRGDLTWRDDNNGQVWQWRMNGATITSGTQVTFNNVAAIVPAASWTALGSGDFGGDGKSDTMWRDGAGNVWLWTMNGAAISSAAQVTFNNVNAIVPAASWNVIGMGDIDGDGKFDVLWRNSAGEVWLWKMNGAAIASAAQVTFNGVNAIVPAASWTLLGVGDFDADGMADAMWRNSLGEVWEWKMNGAVIASAAQVTFNGVNTIVPAASWAFLGAGDLDGDGKADVLWRNSLGEVWLWKMNGAAIASAAQATFNNVNAIVPAPAWEYLATVDIDGDGKADAVWRNTGTAEVWAWILNGGAIASATRVATGLTANWTVQGMQ